MRFRICNPEAIAKIPKSKYELFFILLKTKFFWFGISNGSDFKSRTAESTNPL